MAEASVFVARDTVFVAREHELAQLNAFLGEALASQGHVCFVTGEAGSGKTALVTEFARRAQEAHADLVVAIGDCNAQTGIGDPYLPFREVLGLLTGDVEAKLAQGAITQENAGRLQDFLRLSGQALVEYGPDLIDIFVPGGALATRVGAKLAWRTGWMDRLETLVQRKAEAPAGQDTGPSTGSGQRLEQSHIFEQYTNVVRALTEQQPLMLVLDDLQWADAASIELLFHLGRRIGQSRVLVVGAYRPDEVALGRGGQRHPLEKVLAELKRYYGDVWVNLGRAEETEGRQFVDALLDREPNRLGQGFRQALFQHTEGHPLFTLELLRDMQERGDLVRDEEGRWVEGRSLDWGMLPARVEGVIEERIGRLEAELREALTIASVEGEDFTAQVVARVQEVSERHLVRRLTRELDRQHQLVWERGIERVGRQRLSLYRFRHNLFQRYLYNSLGQTEREFLHEDVGSVLEELYGDQAEKIAAIAWQLARHFLEAGIDEKALQYLLPAGDRARRGYAHAEAADLYGRAAEIAGRLGDEEALRRIYEGLGDVHSVAGDNERAVENYQRALELHTNPRVRADLYNRIGFVYHMNAYDLERGLAAYEQGLQELGRDTETVEAARIHANLGLLYTFLSPNFDLAREYLDRSLTLLEGTRYLKDLANTYSYLAFYHNARPHPDPEEAIEYANRSIALTEQLGDDLPAQPAYINLGLAYGDLQGQWEQALPYFHESLHISTRHGDVMALGWSHLRLASAYLSLAQLDAADRHVAESFSAWERLGHPVAHSASCFQVVIRERMEKPDEAEALLERAKALSRDRPGNSYYSVACIYASKGDPDKALEWLERGRPFFDERHLEDARTDHDLRLLWDHPRFIELMSGSEKLDFGQSPRNPFSDDSATEI